MKRGMAHSRGRKGHGETGTWDSEVKSALRNRTMEMMAASRPLVARRVWFFLTASFPMLTYLHQAHILVA